MQHHSFSGIQKLLVLLCLFALGSTPASANIEPAQAAEILSRFDGAVLTDFDGFLEQLASRSVARDNNVDRIIGNYLDHENLDDEDRQVIFRLLGIYTRLKYGSEALENLVRLVAVQTFQVEGLPQYENPEFHRIAEVIADLAREFRLSFRNVDDRVYEITLEGSSAELVGFHAHADVVPVNPELWVLEDGTRLDPFKVTRIGNRLYGRGTQDDKNGIIVALYAMKVIKEENLPLARTLRLLVDTTEETTSDAIPWYFDRNPVPNYNLALDGGYPVTIAEKGYGVVEAGFPVRQGSGEGAEILSLSGGLATNQIPSTSTAVIASRSPDQLVALLNREGAGYVLAHGNNFSISASPLAGERIRLDVIGDSAHSSDPGSGVNPVSRMLDFIHGFEGRQVFQRNHITDAAGYAAENWGLDYLGNTLGIAYAHEFMGPLTTALTRVVLDDGQLRLAVNLRMPIGKSTAQLEREISAALDNWIARQGVEMTVTFEMGEPMYRNPEGKWVNALLDVATENLDLPREFAASSGGTSVHDLPNGVQFGLAMPDKKYTGHNANEFKELDQFMIDLQIVTEMMVRIGSMDAL